MARAFEVHVVQLGPGGVALEVHEHPDATGRATVDAQLLRAQEGHVAEAEPARRLGRETGWLGRAKA